jgi:hypothetical protein
MVTGAITMPRPDIEALIAHYEVRLAPPTTAALTSSSPRGPKPSLVIHGTLWTCNAFHRLVLPLADTGCRTMGGLLVSDQWDISRIDESHELRGDDMQITRNTTETDDSGSPVSWGEHVTDEEYGAAPAIER